MGASIDDRPANCGSSGCAVPRCSASASPSMIGSTRRRHPAEVASIHSSRRCAAGGSPEELNWVAGSSHDWARRSASTMARRSPDDSSGSGPSSEAMRRAAAIVVRQAASGSRSAGVNPKLIPPEPCNRCTCFISSSRSRSSELMPSCSIMRLSCSKSNPPGVDIGVPDLSRKRTGYRRPFNLMRQGNSG